MAAPETPPAERSYGGRMPRAVIASGAGRYADPWHPYPETSAALADLLRADGWDARVIADPDVALTQLAGAELLVVNAGDPWRNPDAAPAVDPAAEAGLAAALDRGIGVVATHSAVSSLRDYPAWSRTIGGEWKNGSSWHPEIGDASVRAVVPGHDIVPADFTAFDERYTDLAVDAAVHVLAVHDLDGVAHPLVWTHEATPGRMPVRAVVSALGHDARAYDSAELRAVLARAARWSARLDP
ncbi:ThuA domain-containing protein [Microbacterium sp. HD4P20]|uniref:ThuA domain-containing protein n=1 Tax=Microbacterium sp. HD4P20 TaxID=2864874 RepID=UPI001C643843|nr:ThuA domain-containing protein [Microbacterium sp. HD4P20]MCP2635937.1 ThuA domain-containing protein [Microbacterium sp. HD4P20]